MCSIVCVCQFIGGFSNDMIFFDMMYYEMTILYHLSKHSGATSKNKGTNAIFSYV